MTAVICSEYERPMGRQFLPTRNGKSMSARKIHSQHRKPGLLRHAFEKAALAPDAAKPFSRSQPGITRRLQLPRFHRDQKKMRSGSPLPKPTK